MRKRLLNWKNSWPKHLQRYMYYNCMYLMFINDFVHIQLRESESALSSLQASHAKAQSENADVGQQLSEAESKISTLTKSNHQLNGQVDDLKSDLQSETTVRHSTYM